MLFPGIKEKERLHPFQERIVLECVVQLLLEHGLCLKHEGLLIFPTLFPVSATRDGAPIGHSVSLYYDFSGAIDNIYSSLVVHLALSEQFGRVRLWEGEAEFEQAGQGICGLRKIGNRRGVAHMDLLFGPDTSAAVRDLFTVFVEDHLRKEGVSITEVLASTCVSCQYRFEEPLLRDRLADGYTDVLCPRCETRNRINQGAEKTRVSNPAVEEELFALKTVIGRKSEQAVREIKRAFEEAQYQQPTAEPIRILHLSDVHFTADDDPVTRLQPLISDLTDQQDGLGLERLDYLVISGDLTNRASAEEFEQAYQFISQLIERFELSAERCIIVPGNHDLSWDQSVYDWKQKRLVDEQKQKPGSFARQGDGYLVRNEEKHHLRFENFGKFYHTLVQQPYPLKADEQYLSFLFPETRLQFLAMNSAWEIDEFFKTRSSINVSALSKGLLKADEQTKKAKEAGTLAPDVNVLRIAVWHHPATGNEKIQDDAFLERLRPASVRLCLHGHVHEDRADLIGYLHPTRKIHVAGAGSFGAVAKDRPESIGLLFDLWRTQPEHLTVARHPLKIPPRSARPPLRKGAFWSPPLQKGGQGGFTPP